MVPDGYPKSANVLRTTVRARLRLNHTSKYSLSDLCRQQREFYNPGVERALAHHHLGEPVPSDYSAYKEILTPVRRGRDHRGSHQNPILQRSGLAAGLAAVRLWKKHRGKLENNLSYWKGRAEDKPDDFKALRKCSAVESKLARRRESRTKRLFRSWKEEEGASGCALVYREATSVRSENGRPVLRLPGGRVLPIEDRGFPIPEGHTFTGAVRVADLRPPTVTERPMVTNKPATTPGQHLDPTFQLPGNDQHKSRPIRLVETLIPTKQDDCNPHPAIR